MYLHILYVDVVVSIAKYGIITHYIEGIADMSINEPSRVELQLIGQVKTDACYTSSVNRFEDLGALFCCFMHGSSPPIYLWFITMNIHLLVSACVFISEEVVGSVPTCSKQFFHPLQFISLFVKITKLQLMTTNNATYAFLGFIIYSLYQGVSNKKTGPSIHSPSFVYFFLNTSSACAVSTVCMSRVTCFSLQ